MAAGFYAYERGFLLLLWRVGVGWIGDCVVYSKADGIALIPFFPKVIQVGLFLFVEMAAPLAS